MATISGLTETRLATGSSGLSHAMLCFYLKRLPKLDASLAELSRQIWWWNIEELWPALCCSQPCQSRPRSAAQGAPPPTTRRNRKTGLGRLSQHHQHLTRDTPHQSQTTHATCCRQPSGISPEIGQQHENVLLEKGFSLRETLLIQYLN